ncbi:MAG TPA: methyltransferase domain-containing protein [Candidatus Limnocylindrales bacterium]
MSRAGRDALISTLRVGPPPGELVRSALDRAFADAEARGGLVVALDAGCGRNSILAAYRSRIGRFVGADVHSPPDGSLPYLDEFVVADVCADSDAFPPASFDVILSNFTVEHFADPPAAFANLRRWLRPGGHLVLTTVNRRHPFVRSYLGIPPRARARLQRLVKATAADAHPLVGACNDPRTLQATLALAGFTSVDIQTTGHLARAWGRRLPTFTLGLIGDLAVKPVASRRSTIVAEAVAP